MVRTAAYSVALCMALSGVAMRVSAEPFAAADQALWIDRHNYFRMTALPFAAGNMLRMKWSAALATQAEADASACAAKSSGGVNAALVANSGSPVDAAMKTWVVDTAMGVFATLKAPKAAGDPVGTGVYNSYSQVVWSSTNEVGCAKAACGAQVGVACRYAAAGNDGASPWYVHGAAGSACPSGQVSKVGLCVTSVDDASYNDIAPIADGQHAYDVFKDFIPNMQKALAGQAVAPAAAADAATPAAGTPAAGTPAAGTPAAGTPAAGTPAAGTPAAGTPAAETPAAGTPAAGAPASGSAASGAAATPAAATPGAAATPAAGTPGAASPAAGSAATTPTAPGAASSATTPAAGSAGAAPSAPTRSPTSGSGDAASATPTDGSTPAPMVTKIVDGKVYVRVPKTTAPAAGSAPATGSGAGETPAAATGTDDSATPSPMVTKVVDGKVYVRVPKTTAPTSGSSAGASPSAGDSATPEPSVTKVVDGKVYVRIKKTDNADEVVGTVKPSSDTGTTFSNQATTAPAGAATTAASSKSTTSGAATESPTAIGANNKSEGEVETSSFSAAGVAGVIVIGCVAIAGVAVFVSYRKNQQRQRDIMQNGGIHVL